MGITPKTLVTSDWAYCNSCMQWEFSAKHLSKHVFLTEWVIILKYAVVGYNCVKLKLAKPIWHEVFFLCLQTITIHSDSDCQNSQ